MDDSVTCLDTGVIIKFLIVEEPVELSEVASELMRQTVANGRIIMPAFAWAETGSVLRKKVRQGFLEPQQAAALWEGFSQLPIDFIDTDELRARAWQIADEYDFSTLYDAGFLACAEIAGEDGSPVAFWTADMALIRSLGPHRPTFVHRLGIDPI